jgi:hypothetical protein
MIKLKIKISVKKFKKRLMSPRLSFQTRKLSHETKITISKKNHKV